MTPAARYQAAIEILDVVLSGVPVEQALTGWARRSRYAGSGDRAAVRDHVFDAVRCKRSFAATGGAMTGRGLVLGALRQSEIAPVTIFDGTNYGPAALSEAEQNAGHAPETDAEQLDIPDWLWPVWCDSLDQHAKPVAQALQHRAPVFLRVNLAQTTRETAIADLAEQGVEAIAHAASVSALQVSSGARRVRQSQIYQSGGVELQDAASQAVVDSLPLRDGMRVLDYCAGGGGKALAIAARAQVKVFAHDIAADRMRDLPARAERAQAQITLLDPGAAPENDPFDIVLCDAPCSGSGSWRRAPDAKWQLDPARLDDLTDLQDQVLDEAARLVGKNGILAYATCSVLRAENEDRIAAFLARSPGWSCVFSAAWLPDQGTDGFYTAHLMRV